MEARSGKTNPINFHFLHACFSIVLLPLVLAGITHIVTFIDSNFECVFTEEGYNNGVSPEPLVNVTAVPLVSEILQVGIPSTYLVQCTEFMSSSEY